MARTAHCLTFFPVATKNIPAQALFSRNIDVENTGTAGVYLLKFKRHVRL